MKIQIYVLLAITILLVTSVKESSCRNIADHTIGEERIRANFISTFKRHFNVNPKLTNGENQIPYAELTNFEALEFYGSCTNAPFAHAQERPLVFEHINTSINNLCLKIQETSFNWLESRAKKDKIDWSSWKVRPYVFVWSWVWPSPLLGPLCFCFWLVIAVVRGSNITLKECVTVFSFLKEYDTNDWLKMCYNVTHSFMTGEIEKQEETTIVNALGSKQVNDVAIDDCWCLVAKGKSEFLHIIESLNGERQRRKERSIIKTEENTVKTNKKKSIRKLLGSFENSYIPENPRTSKPLTFSKNRLRGAKNRSNTSPAAKKKIRKNVFFSKTLHICKKKKFAHVHVFLFCFKSAQIPEFFYIFYRSLYNTYLNGFVKKN
ncbi:hypothetical protein LXL04_011882 [Taraxacum kok-saghyz]